MNLHMHFLFSQIITTKLKLWFTLATQLFSLSWFFSIKFNHFAYIMSLQTRRLLKLLKLFVVHQSTGNFKFALSVYKIEANKLLYRRFRKNIEAGDNECCYYRVQDCSPRQVDVDPTSFYVS